MTSPKAKPNTPLLTNISQFDVDFVIPRLGVDIPIGIDPFLLFKSRDPIFKELHNTILGTFNMAIEALRQDDITGTAYLFDFPEVQEIGFGYTSKSKRGSGVGGFLSKLLIETLKDSPALVERGVRHIEEMQLVSVGIGADRTSDIAANLIKQFLIEYTQKQCQLWEIPLTSGVPVSHIYNPKTVRWYDDYVDLPVSIVDQTPIILVPRRIVRVLPWINYDDYFRMEFSAYLRAKRVRKQKNVKPSKISKSDVISITRAEIERIDRYVDLKEQTAIEAQPSLGYLDGDQVCSEAARLKNKLFSIPSGQLSAIEYQKTILEILNYLFNPELIDGAIEVETFDGTERRDIVFTNDSDQSFWSYLRNEHSNFLIMFEVKNTQDLKPMHFNQVATYVGERLGHLAFIVTRMSPSEANTRKAFSIYNDSNPRKMILVLSDDDLSMMMDMKCKGTDPMRFIQKIYRRFRQTVQ